MTEPLRAFLYAPHFAEYALRLAAGLAERVRVLLICEHRNLAAEAPPDLIAQARRRITLVTFDGSAGFPAGPFTRHVRLPWLINCFKPDIAHLQEQADGPTAAMLTRLSRRIPVVLTVHDPRPHSGADADYAARGVQHRERLRAGAAAYHVHGAYCERELRATRTIDRPVLSTALGAHFLPAPEAMRAGEAGTMLFFGRMEVYKGLETLLDAAEILRAQGCQFRLIVAGRGPELTRLAGRLRAPDIELHDAFIEHNDVISLFQRASLVVAPYWDATQSAVVASAFANGRPVVGSSVGGLMESVAHGRDGILVPPNDPPSLAAALATLLLDRTKLEVLAAGTAKRLRSDLAWDAIALRLEGLYREVVASYRDAHQ